MPYTKKAAPRKSYYGPVAKRANVYGPAAMQLTKDVAYLATLINSEPKYHIVDTSDNLTSTNNPLSLSAIPQGDGAGSRDGNVVLPRYIALRIYLEKSQDASAANRELVRVITFLYSGETTSAAPSVTQAEILNTAAQPLSTLNPDDTGAKYDRSRRIRVLRDEIIGLDTVANPSKVLDYNIQINGTNTRVKQHMKYYTQSTTDPVSNGLYVLIMSDNSSGTYLGSYKVFSKLTYYDN